MSRDELHILVEQRQWDADCRLLRRHCAPLRRDLEGPGVIGRRARVMPQRCLSGPVHIHGHSFAALEPILIAGPTVTPGLTTCLVEWVTDVPAYHWIRTRPTAGGVNTVVGPIGPSTNAAVTAVGLDPERESYWLDIQSAIDAGGGGAFPWYPDDDSLYFYTLCTHPLVYSNVTVSKQGWGKLTYLHFTWNTQVQADEKHVRHKPVGGIYTYLGPFPSSSTFHAIDDLSFRFLAGSYRFNVRNKNMCGVQSDWSAEYSFIVTAGGGVIQG